MKILKIFLTPENLETGFEFEKLAKETEGYSGSDLKVLVHLLDKFRVLVGSVVTLNDMF